MSSTRTPADNATFAAMMTSTPMSKPPTAKQLAAMRRTVERLAAGQEPVAHETVAARSREGTAAE